MYHKVESRQVQFWVGYVYWMGFGIIRMGSKLQNEHLCFYSNMTLATQKTIAKNALQF